MEFDKEYIEACRKAAWLQERWKPRFGDWVHRHNQGCQLVIDYYATLITTESEGCKEGSQGNKRHYTWLPSQRQLEEMLEEEGCVWFLGKMDELAEDEVGGPAEPDYRCVADGIDTMAPSPGEALLKALEAVMKQKGGEKDGA